MIDLDKEQSEIRRYLLRRLDEKEQPRIEERFVTDPKFREAVLVVEDELIEDYLAGLLAADERDDFINHYLSAPRQLEELRLSQALRDYATQWQEVEEGVTATESPRSPNYAIQWQEVEKVPDTTDAGTTRGKNKIINLLLGKGRLPALAVVFLLLIVLTLALKLVGKWRGVDQLAVRNAEVALLNREPSVGGSPLTVKLTNTLRGAPQEGQKVSIPPGTKIVQLLFSLPRRPYQSYGATLHVNDGPEVFTVGDLYAEDTNEGQLLKLRIPARLLTPEDYILSVKGSNNAGQFEDTAEYFFRVVK